MRFLNKIISPNDEEKNQEIFPFHLSLIKISNLINLLYILLSIFYILLTIYLTDSGIKGFSRFLLFIPVCIINILLTHFHLNLLSKILTVYMPFLFIYVLPVYLKSINGGMFIWFPYGIMITGSTSFIIFSMEKEKDLLNNSLLFFTLAAIFYDRILLLGSPPDLDLSFIYLHNYLYYQVSKIFLVAFLFSSLYVAKIIIYKYRQKLNSINLLKDQKNQELNNLNANLENLVKNRTERLNVQNKRIKELAFSNAHIVRASLARIIRLINFFDQQTSNEGKEYAFKNIKSLAKDLDEETNRIEKYLIEES